MADQEALQVLKNHQHQCPNKNRNLPSHLHPDYPERCYRCGKQFVLFEDCELNNNPWLFLLQRSEPPALLKIQRY